MELKYKNINSNKNDKSNNEKIQYCIAINNHCFNPILQYLDDCNFTQRNKFYRSKTENIDDMKNNPNLISQNNNINNNKNWLNPPKIEENYFLFNKINLEEKKFDKLIMKNKKKEFADASSDTSLDNIISNNFQKKIINKSNAKINNTKIDLGMFNNQYKAYIPKSKLYKNNKYFNKSQIAQKNEDCKSDIKFYNFKDVVDLFGKKLSFCKKPKITAYNNNNNNFRNKSLKFYSCSNNININFIRRSFYKNYKNKNSFPFRRPRQYSKDSDMDLIEDLEASLTKKLLNQIYL